MKGVVTVIAGKDMKRWGFDWLDYIRCGVDGKIYRGNRFNNIGVLLEDAERDNKVRIRLSKAKGVK